MLITSTVKDQLLQNWSPQSFYKNFTNIGFLCEHKTVLTSTVVKCFEGPYGLIDQSIGIQPELNSEHSRFEPSTTYYFFSTVRIRIVISLHPYSICVSSPLSLIACEDLDLVIYGIKHNRTVILKNYSKFM